MGNTDSDYCLAIDRFTISPEDPALNCVVAYYPNEPNLFGIISLEMLQPNYCWPKNETTGEYCNTSSGITYDGKISTSKTVELALYSGFFVFLFLIFILIVNLRSCSRIATDWFRIIALYISATLILILFFTVLGPMVQLGATRQILVGALMHNGAEVYLIGQLWHGVVKSGSLNVKYWCIFMSYGMIVALITAILPLNVGLFMGLFQGFAIDWTMVISFAFCAYKLGKLPKPEKTRKYRALSWSIAAGAIFVHCIGGYAFAGIFIYLLNTLGEEKACSRNINIHHS